MTMRKLLLAALLLPCFVFAASPIYILDGNDRFKEDFWTEANANLTIEGINTSGTAKIDGDRLDISGLTFDLDQLEQGGATTGQALMWSGSAWSPGGPVPTLSGSNVFTGPTTFSIASITTLSVTGTSVTGPVSTGTNINESVLVARSVTGLGSDITADAYELLGSDVSNRLGIYGASNATLGINDAYSTAIIAANNVTEAGSGTHPLISQLSVRPIYLAGAGASSTNGATLYIEGPAIPIGGATITNNYALWVDSGSSRFDGNVSVSGTVATAHVALPGNTIVLGSEASAAENGVAIGGATAAETSVAIGDAVTSSGVGIGSTVAAGEDTVAIGYNVTAATTSSVAIGRTVTTGGVDSVGIGHDVQALGIASVAIGFTSAADTAGVAVGDNAYAGYTAIAMGPGAIAVGPGSISIGPETGAAGESWDGSISIGKSAYGIYDHSIAIGKSARTESPACIAIGYAAQAWEANTIQIGTGTNTEANTVQIRGYQLLKGDGTIPAARLGPSNAVTTTNTTPTLLSGTELAVGSGEALAINFDVVARIDGGGFNRYTYKGLAQNIGGTTTLVGSVISEEWESDSSLGVSVAANDSNDRVEITVTGKSGNVDWTYTTR